MTINFKHLITYLPNMRAFLFDQKMSFLLRFICFLFFISSFPNKFVSPAQHDLCRPDQRDALLQFKNEFKTQKPDWDDSFDCTDSPMKSWVKNSDCCSWDGITCEAKSGKVIELQLGGRCLHGHLKSNSSLFRLHHLRDLDLSYNDFTGSQIPSEFEKLMTLERLDLSQSSFSGQIPSKLLRLTKLVSLDLYSLDDVTGGNSLSIDESFLRLLAQNLRNIRELDMSNVDISSKIPHEFSNMSYLRFLNLRSCNLFGEFPSKVLLIPNLQSIRLGGNPNLIGKLPGFHENNSLQELTIAKTSFSGTIPDSISNLKYLSHLDLSESNFSGKIPSSLWNLSSLSLLDLSYNNFVGEIPSSIGNLKLLTFFGVRGNNLNGSFPSALLNLTQLTQLYINLNQFTGFLPPNISQLSSLDSFWADENSFVGPFPSSIFKISSLTQIELEDNQLSDLFGIENITMLPNLETFRIGGNNYKVSPVDLNIFSSLKSLKQLSLSGIPLSTSNITHDSDFSSSLEQVYLSGCNITEFPEFMKNQRNLLILEIPNNKIKGQVPDWLWRLPMLFDVNISSNSFSGFNESSKVSPASPLTAVDLSSNAFQGTIFIPSTDIKYFFASKNKFSGEIPRLICELSFLAALDLSGNNFHGSVPRCLGDYISSLLYLNLRNNHLNGSLPDIFMNATELKSLDVSHNRLIGKLPNSLKGCLSLKVLNVKGNKIDDTFPFWLTSLKKLQILVLGSNAFHGALHDDDDTQVASWFPHLKIIDLSNNDFTGTLKSDYFTNWKAMYSTGHNMQLKYLGDDGLYYDSMVLPSKGIEMDMERILTIYTAIDFSGNKFHGQIPESVGLLNDLHILNLSRNAFTGHIPSSFSNLTALESLDISQNQLSGEIPPKLGDLSSLEWINVSYNQLVGPIPQGTQFQRQNCSSYEGNPGLYGPSLKDICGDINAPASPKSKPEGPKDEEEGWLSWTATWIGFASGVLFGLAMGYIMSSHTQEWFKKTFGLNKHRRTRNR